MKINIWTNGDRSVGIPGDSIDIEWELVDTFDYEERAALKESLKKFWDSQLDFNCYVDFEDECPDCGSRMENNMCYNPNCIINLPDED
jgi:hypothetical protein